MEYISKKSKIILLHNKHKSPRQLIYGKDMIFNVKILMFNSRTIKQTISKPSYQSNQWYKYDEQGYRKPIWDDDLINTTNEKCPLMDLKYENCPFDGSHRQWEYSCNISHKKIWELPF